LSDPFRVISWIVHLSARQTIHETTRRRSLGFVEYLNLSSHCLILSRNRPERFQIPAFDLQNFLHFSHVPFNMILGTEWVVEAVGCNPAILTDLGKMRGVFDRVIRDLDLHVEGDQVWHQFSLPNGVSGLALLSESHLACHTYPEFRAATFNLYCCRNRDAWPWEKRLTEMLGATAVTVRIIDRFIHQEEAAMAEVGSSGS
jgi:S-adenosylmethionine decarboxylase